MSFLLDPLVFGYTLCALLIALWAVPQSDAAAVARGALKAVPFVVIGSLIWLCW